MKKLIIVLMMGLGVLAFSQEQREYHQKEEERKETTNKERLFLEFSKKYENSSPEERKIFFRQMQAKNMMDKLALSEEKQKVSQKLFEEYFAKRAEIMKKFKPRFDKDKKVIDEKMLSNEEALTQLKKRLETAQELLNMRKEYTDKFLQVLTPQQVLQMNRLEKEMTEYFQKHKEKKGK